MACHKWNSSRISEVLWTYNNGFFPQWMEANMAANLILASSKKSCQTGYSKDDNIMLFNLIWIYPLQWFPAGKPQRREAVESKLEEVRWNIVCSLG